MFAVVPKNLLFFGNYFVNTARHFGYLAYSAQVFFHVAFSIGYCLRQECLMYSTEKDFGKMIAAKNEERSPGGWAFVFYA